MNELAVRKEPHAHVTPDDPYGGIPPSWARGGGLLRFLRQWYQALSGIALTRAGIYYLVILSVVAAVAVVRQINIMLILAGMLLGPIVYNLRLAGLFARALKVRRLLPAGVCAGDLVVVRLEVTNTASRRAACALRISDEVLRVRPGQPTEQGRPTVIIPYLGPGETAVFSYEARLMRRGRYRFGPLVVTTEFPFGLVERKVIIPLHDELVVCPRLGKLTRRWRFESREPIETVPQRSGRESRQGEEFFGVREWQRGDSLRWIHWRSSARHRKWVVRQFELPRNQDLALLVDLARQPSQTIPEPHLEYLLSFAATLLAQTAREGGGNIFFGVAARRNFWMHGPMSSSLLRITLEHLAEVEPADEDSLAALWTACQTVVAPGTRTVVISWRAREVAGVLRAVNAKSAGSRPASPPQVLQVPGPDVDQIFVLDTIPGSDQTQSESAFLAESKVAPATYVDAVK